MTKVEVWSDVVCPWCFVGKRRLERALARFEGEVDVEFKSFELDPDAPRIQAGSASEHLQSKYGRTADEIAELQQRLREIGAEEGLDLRLEATRRGNSFDAHRLLHLAKERNLQDALKERLMHAYFTESQPIGDPTVLRRLAVEAGLEGAEVDALLAGDRYADAVRADEREAARIGINGVPFFVVGGRYAISGAQPAELIVRALEQSAGEAA